jgi:small subunit ribosomal protein S9
MSPRTAATKAKDTTTAAKATPKEKIEKHPKTLQAVGRRKSAVARVRLTPNGSGTFTVNGKKYEAYFPYQFTQNVITEPLKLTGFEGRADISAKVNGGGIESQAEAVRLGIARIMIVHNPELRSTFKKMGWLTRDPREKERKKPGLKRARRAPQWQKR